MGQLIFISGPVRSGKSRRAVEIAQAWGDRTVFVATWRPTSDDPEMSERVRRHRTNRPPWRTLEAPDEIAGELEKLRPAPAGVILDCLTLWISDRLAQTDDAIAVAWEQQLARFRAAAWPTIVVSNEVGWSPVPADALTRRFRDLAGALGQRTAAAADEAFLMVAGCALRLK